MSVCIQTFCHYNLNFLKVFTKINHEQKYISTEHNSIIPQIKAAVIIMNVIIMFKLFSQSDIDFFTIITHMISITIACNIQGLMTKRTLLCAVF